MDDDVHQVDEVHEVIETEPQDQSLQRDFSERKSEDTIWIRGEIRKDLHLLPKYDDPEVI